MLRHAARIADKMRVNEPISPAEPLAPILNTPIPGPKAQQFKSDVGQFSQDGWTIKFPIDLKGSVGNYAKDIDGNYILDLFGQIASLPLGYNHPDLMYATAGQEYHKYLAQRPACAVNPDMEWMRLLRDSVLKVAPKGLTELFLSCGCGTQSNENAYKAAFLWYKKKQRGGSGPTEEELKKELVRGNPDDMAILSFQKAFHGRALGALSTTRSKMIAKIDIPAFDWPAAPFPEIKHPYSEFEAENREEENRCLEEVERILKTNKKAIAGVIIEPVLAEGGDQLASPYFYLNVQRLTKEAGAAFIVDEVQTGGGSTGKFWAYQHWGELADPDIVTFAKKIQACGYYAKPEFRPDWSKSLYGTWMGDPIRLLNFKHILRTIEADRLIYKTQHTGSYLRAQLSLMEKKYPQYINNVRGLGAFLAFDMPSADDCGLLVRDMLAQGINMGPCGANSIRIRPSLILENKHVDLFADRFEKMLFRWSHTRSAH